MSIWEDRTFDPPDLVITVGLGVVAGLLFGYGYFLIGVFAVGVSSDTAFQTSGVVTVSTSVVAWRFVWREFYGPTAGETDA